MVLYKWQRVLTPTDTLSCKREERDTDGEKDYNHVSDKEYVNFRKQAELAYSKRAEFSKESQQAYKAGDKQRASELSAKAKEQLAVAERFNRKAAEFVFIENNRDSDDNDIDLHGLYVKEAEYILKQRIISGIQKNQATLDCIVGKGLHSQNGIAKLKPAVEQLCADANLRCWIDPKNTGVLHIDIKNASVPPSWYNVDAAGIGAMDENYYAYHPQEQAGAPTSTPNQYQQQHPQQQNYHQQQHPQQQDFHQQQQQQQQQQPNQQNDAFLKALCAIGTLLFRSFCR